MKHIMAGATHQHIQAGYFLLGTCNKTQCIVFTVLLQYTMKTDGLFNDIVRSSYYRLSHDRMTINNELFSRKQSWYNLMNYNDIFLEHLKKTMRKTTARVTSTPAKIQNQHHPNENQTLWPT
jgi:phosphoribosylformylglycinamidine (FGAM) synthase-like amidotransferase family enzyme